MTTGMDDRFFVAGAFREAVGPWAHRIAAIVALAAICAASSGCRTRPRMVPMVVYGKPAMALEYGANPQGDIDWPKTGAAIAGGGGVVGLLVWGIIELSKQKGGGDTYHIDMTTQSGNNNAGIAGRDQSQSQRRDEMPKE